MPKLTAEEKLEEVRKQAFQRGLRIKPDPRLNNSPYRAMHEHAGKELDEPYIKGFLTYAPYLKKDKEKLAMDLNHENIEHYKMSHGWKYKAAHKFSNRKQLDFDFMDDKY